MSALAVGGLAGALVAGAWKIRRRGVLVLWGAALLSVCLTGMAWAQELWSTAVLLGVAGAIAGLVNVHLVAWVMQRIAPEVRGRVSSVILLSSLGVGPISLAAAGFLAQAGTTVLFIGTGAALLVVTGAAASARAVRDIGE